MVQRHVLIHFGQSIIDTYHTLEFTIHLDLRYKYHVLQKHCHGTFLKPYALGLHQDIKGY